MVLHKWCYLIVNASRIPPGPSWPSYLGRFEEGPALFALARPVRPRPAVWPVFVVGFWASELVRSQDWPETVPKWPVLLKSAGRFDPPRPAGGVWGAIFGPKGGWYR